VLDSKRGVDIRLNKHYEVAPSCNGVPSAPANDPRAFFCDEKAGLISPQQPDYASLV
jgi:hypothetical protein